MRPSGAAGNPTNVLLIDDRKGDILWLIDYLEECGYMADHVTNEQAARSRIECMLAEEQSYALAIIDIMVAVKGIMEMVELDDDVDEEFFGDSRTTGIRLCRWIREDLEISSDKLPIVCISARPDIADIRRELEAIDSTIKIFGQMTENPEDFRSWLAENL